jgi:hypothetical protein
MNQDCESPRKRPTLSTLLTPALLLCCICGNNPQSTGEGAEDEPPGISSFSAFPSAIQSGDTAILSVFYRRASTARIDPEPGVIDPDENSFRVSPLQTTTYTLTVTNSSGTVTREVTVTVDGPSITVQPEKVTLTEGETAEFSVIASGASLRYQWHKNQFDIPGATDALLRIESVTDADSGSVFEVTVECNGGTVTSIPVMLDVRAIPLPTTFFVSMSGNDSTGNGTPSSPWRTVQYAADSVMPGDTVVVGAGSYDERVKVKRGGAENHRVTFRSETPHSVLLLHGFQIDADHVTVEGFDITHDKGGWLENGIWMAGNHLLITGNYIHDVPGAGIQPSWSGDGWNHVTLSNNRIYNCNSGLSAYGYDWLVENNEIERLHNTGAGDSDYSRLFGRKIVFRGNHFHGSLENEIGTSHVDGWQFFSNNGESLDDVLIEGNWVEDFHQGAMLSGAGLGTITFRNNVIVSKSWGGAWGICGGNVPNARIIALNNTFKVLYHGIGVRNSFESGLLEVWNNIIYNSGSAYWSENVPVVGSHNLVCLDTGRTMGDDCRIDDICDTAPLFVNVTDGGEDHWDFSLSAGSPAIDNGLDLSVEFGFNTDINGRTRPAGTGWDIGAYERPE